MRINYIDFTVYSSHHQLFNIKILCVGVGRREEEGRDRTRQNQLFCTAQSSDWHCNTSSSYSQRSDILMSSYHISDTHQSCLQTGQGLGFYWPHTYLFIYANILNVHQFPLDLNPKVLRCQSTVHTHSHNPQNNPECLLNVKTGLNLAKYKWAGRDDIFRQSYSMLQHFSEFTSFISATSCFVISFFLCSTSFLHSRFL